MSTTAAVLAAPRSARRAELARLEADAHRDLEALRARLTEYREARGLPPAPVDVAAGR